jgi:hypothetical protein
MSSAQTNNAQRAMTERFRAESVLSDSGVELGCQVPLKPEFGPAIDQYYRNKHAKGRCGRFWLHHTSRRSFNE